MMFRPQMSSAGPSQKGVRISVMSPQGKGLLRWQNKIKPILPIVIILFSILLGPAVIVRWGDKTPRVLWVDVVLSVVIGIWILKGKFFRFRLAGIEQWLILYIGIAAIGLPMTVDFLRSLAILQLRILPLFVFIIVFNSLKTQQDIRVTLKALLVFIVLLAVQLLIYGWLNRSEMTSPLPGQVTKSIAQTTWGRSNYLASLFIILILPLISMILMKPYRRLLFKFAAAGIVIIALIFTQSRGAFLSLLLGVVLWILLGAFSGRFRKTGRVIGYISFAVILCIAAWHILPEEVTGAMTSSSRRLVDQFFWERNSISRLNLLIEAWAGFIKSPIIGIGIGNQYTVLTVAESVHNLYLETALESGLIGLAALAAYLIAVARVFFHIWKKAPKTQSQLIAESLMISFLISLINAAQEPSFWGPEYAYVLVILIALACAMSKIGIPDFAKR